MNIFERIIKNISDRGLSIFHIDWLILSATVLISLAGLVTMNSFAGDRYFFDRQVIWIAVSLIVFFVASTVDWRFLRRTGVVVSLFLVSCGLLALLFIAGQTVKGAQSWFDFGGFSFQPSDPIKLVLILVLAKYFTRRHIEIAHVKHLIISGMYALALFVLVLIQPDFGSAMIIFSIWFGTVFVSGMSKKHLLAITLIAVVLSGFMWSFVFEPYQKDRIISFIHPLADIQGAGYNAYQSTIAVGSGEILGKGVGYGTQSKLQFLPEYETDFIFAAFAEEWGFVGAFLILVLFGVIIWRVLKNSILGESNFEMLFGMGLAILFMSHIIIHVGMNIGLLPVTGITIPFMSYGGSHLLTEFLGLGILMGMRRYSRAAHREDLETAVSF